MPKQKTAVRLGALVVSAMMLAVQVETGPLATPISIYGAWHCGNDFCTWASVRNMTDFDQKNHWLIDRGDGPPSVNLVILSFVHPLRLLNKTNDAQTVARHSDRHDAGSRRLLQEPRHSRHAVHWRHHLHRRLEPGACN